jgi:hypothetical protein
MIVAQLLLLERAFLTGEAAEERSSPGENE